LPDRLSEIFLQAGLDRANQLEPLEKIGALAQSISTAFWTASEASRRKTIIWTPDDK
jgi:hypothetical protein